jgi:HNH endonuclease
LGVGERAGDGWRIAGENIHSPGFMSSSENWLGAGMGQREAIVKARVGQGKFRDDVFEMWNKQCPVTKVDMPAILVASHIVSWQLSTDEEKLDPFNGFPLAPAVDKLFDKGYISFSDSGELLVHNVIRGEVLSRLGISPDAIITGLSERHRAYLRRHRQTHGFSC